MIVAFALVLILQKEDVDMNLNINDRHLHHHQSVPPSMLSFPVTSLWLVVRYRHHIAPAATVVGAQIMDLQIHDLSNGFIAANPGHRCFSSPLSSSTASLLCHIILTECYMMQYLKKAEMQYRDRSSQRSSTSSFSCRCLVAAFLHCNSTTTSHK